MLAVRHPVVHDHDEGASEALSAAFHAGHRSQSEEWAVLRRRAATARGTTPFFTGSGDVRIHPPGTRHEHPTAPPPATPVAHLTAAPDSRT
ncbi:hypothetical protein GCM10009660_12310 [Catellatospora bangladeshensis]